MSIAEWKALLAHAKTCDAEAAWEVAGRYDDGCKDKGGKILVDVLRIHPLSGFGAPPNTVVHLLKTPWALFWETLKKAFNAGDSLAAINIAITYRDSGNFRKAVQWFRESVASGDDDALIQLGIHYYWGKGVRKNLTAAVRCFRKATKGKNICESSRDDAFFYLGIAYLEGKGVRASISTARKLLKRANVDNDHPAARRILWQIE